MSRFMFSVCAVFALMMGAAFGDDDTLLQPLNERAVDAQLRGISTVFPGAPVLAAASPGDIGSRLPATPVGDAGGPRVNPEDRHGRSGVTPPLGLLDWLEIWGGYGYIERPGGRHDSLHLRNAWGKLKWRGIPISEDGEHRVGAFLTYGLVHDGFVGVPNDPVAFSLEKMGGGFNYTYTHFGKTRGKQLDIELGYGLRVDDFETKSQSWNGDQQSDVVLGAIRFDYFRLNHRLLPRWSTYLTVEEDVRQKVQKHATPGTTEANRTYREFGFIVDVVDWFDGGIRPRIGGAMVSQPGAHESRGAVIGGFSFWRDAIILEGRYEHGSGDDPDLRSVGVAMDIYRFGRTVCGLFGGSSEPSESRAEAVRPVPRMRDRARNDESGPRLVAHGPVR